jgi:spore maturation protein SpmA/spore maturation protein SpmB
MNIIFLSIVLIAFVTAGGRQFFIAPASGQLSPMEALSKAMVDSAAASVELAFGLVGVMTLFLGLMKVAEKGGLLTVIARLIRPLMARLFPEVPPEHPAMGAMILNLSANVLGLGNAATPFGIRAMQELNRLNPTPGSATDAMALFLAINTSSVTILPTGVIALRAAAGSADPAGILPTTLFATACATATAIIAVKLLRRLTRKPLPGPADAPPPADEGPAEPPEVLPDTAQGAYPVWASVLALTGILALIPVTVAYGRSISPWILPGLMAGFLIFGLCRRVRVYEAFVDGAKDGFQVAVKIIPYLVAILVAVGMLRASGAMDLMVGALGPWTARLGLPAEALPMALMRPLSGSGAFAILASVINDPAIGPDSYTGYLVSTLQGCTETTFYVLAVYFGAVQVRRIRYTLAAGLIADLAGVAASVAACTYLLTTS